VPVFEFDLKHGVGQWLNDGSLENDGVFLWLGQCTTPSKWLAFNPCQAATKRTEPKRGASPATKPQRGALDGRAILLM